MTLTKQHLERMLLAAVFVLAFAWVSSSLWLDGETFFLRDFWINYFPSHVLLSQHVREGALWLWNPYLGGGLPVLPDANNGIFYPPHLVFAFLNSSAQSLSFCVALHAVWAAWGTYRLARRSGTKVSALVSAVMFSMGGLMASNLINVQFAFAYAWVPWWFYFALELAQPTAASARRAWQGVCLAFVWAMQLLASDPQTAYLEGLSIPFLFLGNHAKPQAKPGSTLLLFAGAALLAVGLAAPQVMALAEAIGQTQRSSMSDAQALEWSLHPLRFWESVMPAPWGLVTQPEGFWGGALVGPTYSNFYFQSLYLSALILPLGVAQLCWGKTRGGWGLWLGVCLLMLLACGTTVPLYRMLRKVLPLWELFRYPERLLLIPSLAAAVMAGRGVMLWARPERRVAWLCAATCALVWGAWQFPIILGLEASQHENASPIVASSAWHAVAVLLVASLLALWPSEPFKAVRPWLVAVWLCFDVVWAAKPVWATWSPPEPSSRVTLPTDGRILFVPQELQRTLDLFPQDARARREMEDKVSRPNLNVLQGVASTNAVSSLGLRRTVALNKMLGFEAAALQYGTTHVVADAQRRFKLFAEAGPLEGRLRWFNSSASAPPVICSNTWTTVEQEEDAALLLSQQKPSIVGDRSHRSLPRDQPEYVPCELERPKSNVRKVRWAPHEQAMWVRLTENFYPGWQVRFEKQPWKPAFVADAAFVGALVPPKVKEVEFRFRPDWLWPSLLLSLGTGVSLLAMGLYFRPRHPRQGLTLNGPNQSSSASNEGGEGRMKNGHR